MGKKGTFQEFCESPDLDDYLIEKKPVKWGSQKTNLRGRKTLNFAGVRGRMETRGGRDMDWVGAWKEYPDVQRKE